MNLFFGDTNYVKYSKIYEVKKFFLEDDNNDNLEEITEMIGSLRSKEKSENNLEKKTERRAFSIKEAGEIWKNIYGKDFTEVECKICGREGINFYERSTWHISHIKSLNLGGTNDVDNLRPLCKTCNLSMKTKNLIDYCKEKYSKDWEKIKSALKLTE